MDSQELHNYLLKHNLYKTPKKQTLQITPTQQVESFVVITRKPKKK